MNKLIEVTADTFEAEVLRATVPVLLDWYGDHCGPCKRMVPILEDLAAELEGRAKVVKADAIANDELSEVYGISALPTFQVFKNGAEIVRLVGMKSKERLLEALTE